MLDSIDIFKYHYKKDSLSIGVVVHSNSQSAGHGPGVVIIMSDEQHYVKMITPHNGRALYLCNSYKDMYYIPKEECSDGDKLQIKNSKYSFIFMNGEFRIYK